MIICLTGPTAVGKTALSIKLAKKYNAIIINADATSIYKELDIGSAKVTKEEMDGVKHYLIDIKNPDEDYSVADFQTDSRQIINDNKDKNIIVCGGTGLYLNALFYDYNFDKMNNNNYDNLSNEELYDLVLKKDNNISIDKNNRIRLINFLNRKDNGSNKDKEVIKAIYIGLSMPREKLYERVNLRVDKMLEDGLVEEVKTLYQKYPNSNILKRAIGYKEIISYLNNEISLEEATILIKKNTRHFVKRQYTWFNHQMHLNMFDVNDNTYDEIIDFIESLNSK